MTAAPWAEQWLASRGSRLTWLRDRAGEVWVVRWVADEIRPSAPDLARFLSRGLDRMQQVGVGVAEGGFGLVLPEDAGSGECGAGTGFR